MLDVVNTEFSSEEMKELNRECAPLFNISVLSLSPRHRRSHVEDAINGISIGLWFTSAVDEYVTDVRQKATCWIPVIYPLTVSSVFILNSLGRPPGQRLGKVAWRGCTGHQAEGLRRSQVHLFCAQTVCLGFVEPHQRKSTFF